ncbi:MAG: hypothetical protein M3495_19745 [Pseudomonadota bacterium]|nr:hypothetical protein [Pseudomonadota bacterium]
MEAKSWQITGINFKDTSKGFDPVRLIRRKLRLPYSIIRQIEALPSGTPPSDPKGQNDVLRDALIASHVCIIPESRILEILRIATKLFIYGPAGQEPDTPPSTEAALDEWLKAANNAQRRGAREKVLSALRGMHQEIAVLPYTYHREIVRDLFIDNARKVYKGDQTYYELYVQIVDEEFRDHPATADIWLEPILRLSTFPMASSSSQSFRYTLTLSPVSYLSIPKTGLPVTGGAATFAVKCELVEFEVDAQSRKKIDRVSGNPVVKTMLKELYDTSKQSSGPGLYAVTGTLGIAPTTVPPAIELFTQVGDLKYEDFTDATFSFVWIRGRPLSRLVLTPRSRRWRQAVLTRRCRRRTTLNCQDRLRSFPASRTKSLIQPRKRRRILKAHANSPSHTSRTWSQWDRKRQRKAGSTAYG